MLFNLAPHNPNANGIYYDTKTYSILLSSYYNKNKNADMTVYNTYDNTIKYHDKKQHYRIGVVKSIDVKNNVIDICMDDCLQFITPDNYVVEFKFISDEKYFDESISAYRFKIKKVLYAYIINKEGLIEKL